MVKGKVFFGGGEGGEIEFLSLSFQCNLKFRWHTNNIFLRLFPIISHKICDVLSKHVGTVKVF
jgi:hypothetical protein